jgi:hypothetical protein
MKKQNCWEFKKCGRELDGLKAEELGVCPANIEKKVAGVNSGKNGGRACWALAGTLCGGKIQGTFATKLQNCRNCKFYQLVTAEEGSTYKFSKYILSKLKS